MPEAVLDIIEANEQPVVRGTESVIVELRTDQYVELAADSLYQNVLILCASDTLRRPLLMKIEPISSFPRHL